MRENYCQCTADDFYNMLYDRLHDFWGASGETLDLYMKMYEDYVDNGLFSENTHSIAEIVDNDWVNDITIISKGEDDFDELKSLWEKEDQPRDISQWSNYSFIEAVDDENDPTMFLVRY